jgi:hypothetical protein
MEEVRATHKDTGSTARFLGILLVVLSKDFLLLQFCKHTNIPKLFTGVNPIKTPRRLMPLGRLVVQLGIE